MDLVNGLVTSIFDIVLTPLEMINLEVSIAVVSALFGILGLFIFKYISSQKGIKRAKDRIKGHMIEIRIYQDDLVVVGAAVCKVLFNNMKYLGLNLLPFIPLTIPFVFVMAQLVVRYGYEPLPEGEDFKILVEVSQEEKGQISDLQVIAPDWLAAEDLVVVRAPSEARAVVSIRDAKPGIWDFAFKIGDSIVIKQIVIGAETEAPRLMQPERVGDLLNAVLWPAETMIEPDSPMTRIAVHGEYPGRVFAFLPDGAIGVVLGIILYSILAGLAVLKPLGVTI
ncbi:MAG: hypothetical protein ACI8TQ_002130 [Planctomycetota bacterium]|jgi:hypothetical protein